MRVATSFKKYSCRYRRTAKGLGARLRSGSPEHRGAEAEWPSPDAKEIHPPTWARAPLQQAYVLALPLVVLPLTANTIARARKQTLSRGMLQRTLREEP